MTLVFDACALIAYLNDEAGGDVVEELLLNNPGRCVAHAVNLCEVYYHFVRRTGKPPGKAALDDLKRAGVRTRHDISSIFWMRIGELKATQQLALADCFAIELARKLHAQVVTSDHGEFDAIAADGVCEVLFIR
jgi:PIN domain nuclease of toxin-antitoxin system